MEKRINKCIDEYVSGLKQNVKGEIIKVIEVSKNGDENCTKLLHGLLQYVCDYEKCQLKSTDFEKRKRSKNNVPVCEQCFAKKADSSRCTRRKRDGSHFCGTHIKGTPHGVIDETQVESVQSTSGVYATKQDKFKSVEIWLEDINGIMHYIDNNYNVYDNEEILKGIENPKVVYKYEKDYIGGKEIYKILT